ncbi:hypothetical protein FALBO_3071 [Fusarium albosuccineum]|uniref:Uncharacterized protein n=1 Tax=Fusarium albosuccineum TaxID=1237068 RepID=A0A8H4LKF8_9HYPO|nr:hypothetical protein FALBO_3071 [Fusarium albosuccineum]
MSNRTRNTLHSYADALQYPTNDIRSDLNTPQNGQNARPAPVHHRRDQTAWEQGLSVCPCCRPRAWPYVSPYDDDDTDDSYPSYQSPPARGMNLPAARLPPRVALRQLSDRLQEANYLYTDQLVEFQQEHQSRGHDMSKDSLRQWLWNDWTKRRDTSTLESFASTETMISLHLRQVEEAIARPWLEDPLTRARFEHSMRILRVACGEVVRLAMRATEDWQTCRFLVAELRTAKVYADPDGKVHRHLFSGWGHGGL